VAEHLVVGPPGTGKTTYLKRQIGAAAEKYRPEEIVVGSLTRTAATEVAGRVELPRRNVGTLHAHAYSLLGRPRIAESVEGLRDWNEACPVSSWRIDLKHAASPEHDAPTEVGSVSDSTGYELYERMGILRQRMVDRAAWSGQVRQFAEQWEKWKGTGDYYDFTDLIEVAIQRVGELPGCRVFMLDEAQDMSKLEFTLARQWGAGAENFVVVGDPDQNLYEWRGSDPEAFYSGDIASKRVLSQSYRVPQEVHKIAVDWVSQIEDRVDAAYEPTDAVGKVERAGHQYRDPDSLIADAQRRLSDGQSVMVLVSCNYMLNPVCRRLRELGIPFCNPYRLKAGNWNPLVGARRLLAFLRPDPAVWGDEQRLWTWQDVKRWADGMQASKTFRHGFKAEIARLTDTNRFGDLGDDTVDLAKLLAGMKDDECRQALMDMDINWWEDRLDAKTHKSAAFSLNVARRHGAAVLREQPKLIVGTVHSVKGGEADHVYLFPDLSPIAYNEAWTRPGHPRNSVVRQFYVGITRARHSLTLCEASDPYAVDWR
jgi:DNA helicase-2/ATP-dependent DNA helicase PcrA